MSQQDIEAKIGEAWKAHYGGQEDVAIAQFLEIVEVAPDNPDALWGLGLSYRHAGNKDKALDAFRKVKKLIEAHLDTEGGELGRYFMLNRMVTQQIEQIENFLGRNDQSE